MIHVTFPRLLELQDLSLLGLRLVVAIVFGASGYFDLKDPVGAREERRAEPRTHQGTGCRRGPGESGLITGILIQPAALGLIVIGLGAIQKKVWTWKTGFWGEKASGWHYDLMLLAMNLVILSTAGGGLVVRIRSPIGADGVPMDLEAAGTRSPSSPAASKGIGLAVTRALVDEGARVVAGARTIESLDGIPGVTAVAVDLADARRSGAAGAARDRRPRPRRRARQQHGRRPAAPRRLPRRSATRSSSGRCT